MCSPTTSHLIACKHVKPPLDELGAVCFQGHAPPAQLASAQMFAARLGTGPTRVVLLKNMLKALQLLDEAERTDASVCLPCMRALRILNASI